MKINKAYQEKVEAHLKDSKALIGLKPMDYQESIKHKGNDFCFDIEAGKYRLDMPYGDSKHITVESGDINFSEDVKWSFNFNPFKKYVKKHSKDGLDFEFLLFYIPEFKLPIVVLQKKGGAEQELICQKDFIFPKPEKVKKEKPKKEKFEIAKVDEPPMPDDWSYDGSLARMKSLGNIYKRNKLEMALELFQAWRMLHLTPSQAAEMRYTKEEKQTWGNYCSELGISLKTVYNWFNLAKLPYKAESAGAGKAGRKPTKSDVPAALKTAINRFRGSGKNKMTFLDGQVIKPADMDIRIDDTSGKEVVILNKKLTLKMAEVAKYICFADNSFVAFTGENGEDFRKQIGSHGQVFRRC